MPDTTPAAAAVDDASFVRRILRESRELRARTARRHRAAERLSRKPAARTVPSGVTRAESVYPYLSAARRPTMP